MALSGSRRIVFMALAILLTALTVEGASYLLLRVLNPNAAGGAFLNKELSGYSLFRNTPNFVYGTHAPDQQPPVRTDQYGFVSDDVITPDKPPDTFRVFLLGGSAMAGAGQLTQCYEAIRAFPTGIYAYDISIAGRLKAHLQGRFPGKKIQVVNAAVYQFHLHQSMLLYLERVSRFQPDVVINLEGFNDLGSIASGSVWDYAESLWLDLFVQATVRNEGALRRFRWAQLVDYLYARSIGRTPDAPPCAPDQYDYPADAYAREKAGLRQRSQEYLRVLHQYMSILKGDNVRFLFVLQPMLARGINKELADYERRMREESGAIDGARISPRVLQLLGSPQDARTRFKLAGRYFFDDYLSDAIRRSVESQGFLFADMNREITAVGRDVPFYTDLVHLTTDGNRIVARTMADLLVTAGLPR